jgi:predicted O-methyltransferase YrrM
MGRFFAWLAATRRPEVIVEIGTAFGISGMYWAAGLEQAGRGFLITFDPNETWHLIARQNIARISSSAIAVPRTVEEGLDATLEGRSIDICFIDAIHTGDFVRSQISQVLPHMKPGALLLVDDITFSDDMKECWGALSLDQRFRASLTVDERVGLLELPE